MDDHWSMGRELAKVTAAGAFGPGRTFVSFEPDPRFAGQDQFASTIVCGTVTVRDGRECHDRRHDLVIKTKHSSAVLRDAYKTDDQFRNEILFYERLMPFLLHCVRPERGPVDDCVPHLCRYFYGRNDCGDLTARDVIVLENATHLGYRHSGHRLFLDFEHLILALKTLAKFHGMSYRAKHQDPGNFAALVFNIKETQWDDKGQWIITDEGLKVCLFAAMDRLTGRSDGEYDERVRRFRTELLDDPQGTLRHTAESREPMAVLCHGDFNRNNMLFRYDDDGRPVDVLLFDMATVRYASPALDLSFFLYMNTDRRTRDAHWDALLDAYCAALAASLSDVRDVVRVPGRTELDAEMREYAFYGLAHVSFFMRIMMQQQVGPVTLPMMDDYGERDRIMLSFGGDEATDMIADVVQHFIDIKYGATTAL